MPRRPVVVLALLCAAAAPEAHAITAADLRTSLAKRATALGAASGVQVADLERGTVIFERAPDQRRIPASNEKLLVTAAALLRLGPDERFATTVQVRAEPDEDGLVRGDLFLVGGGDPTLGDGGLTELVRQVRASGVRRVQGGVRGDDSLFDRRRGGPRTGFGPDRDMGGWLGALTWAHGRAYPGGPPVVAAARLQRLLRAAGVRFGRAAGAATRPATDLVELASTSSPPLSSIATAINVNSDNFYAETITKQLGARFGAGGATAAGLAVVRSTLGRIGVQAQMADGSGLSRANAVAPRQLLRLLRHMASHELAPTWFDTLAVMGRSGTLRKRLRGTAAEGRCFGKTGTINSVSALSGYCRRPSGALTAFSIMANGVDPVRAKRVEDRMVRAIANLGR